MKYDLKHIKMADVTLAHCLVDSENNHEITDLDTKRIVVLFDDKKITREEINQILDNLTKNIEPDKSDDRFVFFDSDTYEKFKALIEPYKITTQYKSIEKNPVIRDPEYDRIIKKFFKPFDYLKQFWSDDEILNACAACNITLDQICEEFKRPDYFGKDPNLEYIRTSTESIKEYDKHGREYADPVRRLCHVYRVPYQYQGLTHGKVFLYLLYQKYPQLKKFNFEAYEFFDDRYEIYPKTCHIYVPFKALMDKDINAVKDRNLNYAKSYNYGDYTLEKYIERVKNDPNTIELLDTIAAL